MSVSGIGDSSVSSLFSSQMSQTKRPEDYDSSEDFVSSIIGDQDSDGDGQLSASESGFLSDIFSEIDSDGDGYLSQEEMIADLESRQEQQAMMGNMSVMMSDESGSSSLIDTLMEELDSDGDSLISAEESGLSEELFNNLDTDGDGNLSYEELQASMTPPEGMGDVAASSTSSSSSSESSTSEDSEEEYDEYDFNEDGVVTLDELQQAFANGDTSLAGIVGGDSETNQQDSADSGQSGQSILQRMAMRAYEQQNASTSASELLGASA